VIFIRIKTEYLLKTVKVGMKEVQIYNLQMTH